MGKVFSQCRARIDIRRFFGDQLTLHSTQIYFPKQRVKLLKMQRVSSISALTSLHAEFLCRECNGRLFLRVICFFALGYQLTKLLGSQQNNFPNLVICKFEIMEGIGDSYDNMNKYYTLKNIHVCYDSF
jgi:hypothetical protein